MAVRAAGTSEEEPVMNPPTYRSDNRGIGSIAYAISKLPSRRRYLLRRGVATLAIGVLLTFALAVAYRRFYFLPRTQLQALFERLPGVAQLQVDGFDDNPIQWKAVAVEVTLAGGPDRTMNFAVPDAKALRTNTHLALRRLGPFSFSAVGPGERERYDYMDFGTEGPFSGLLPLQLRGCDDAVARYDDFVAAIHRLPRHGECVTRDGKRYSYSIETP
jgi:hypothetical protein